MIIKITLFFCESANEACQWRQINGGVRRRSDLQHIKFNMALKTTSSSLVNFLSDSFFFFTFFHLVSVTKTEINKGSNFFPYRIKELKIYTRTYQSNHLGFLRHKTIAHNQPVVAAAVAAEAVVDCNFDIDFHSYYLNHRTVAETHNLQGVRLVVADYNWEAECHL